jgi:hypothetical protein
MHGACLKRRKIKKNYKNDLSSYKRAGGVPLVPIKRNPYNELGLYYGKNTDTKNF